VVTGSRLALRVNVTRRSAALQPIDLVALMQVAGGDYSETWSIHPQGGRLQEIYDFATGRTKRWHHHSDGRIEQIFY
jgi:hypothetical protein